MNHSKPPAPDFTLDGDTVPHDLLNTASTAPIGSKQGTLFTMYHDAKPNKTARHTAPTLMDWLDCNP